MQLLHEHDLVIVLDGDYSFGAAEFQRMLEHVHLLLKYYKWSLSTMVNQSDSASTNSAKAALKVGLVFSSLLFPTSDGAMSSFTNPVCHQPYIRTIFLTSNISTILNVLKTVVARQSSQPHLLTPYLSSVSNFRLDGLVMALEMLDERKRMLDEELNIISRVHRNNVPATDIQLQSSILFISGSSSPQVVIPWSLNSTSSGTTDSLISIEFCCQQLTSRNIPVHFIGLKSNSLGKSGQFLEKLQSATSGPLFQLDTGDNSELVIMKNINLCRVDPKLKLIEIPSTSSQAKRDDISLATAASSVKRSATTSVSMDSVSVLDGGRKRRKTISDVADSKTGSSTVSLTALIDSSSNASVQQRSNHLIQLFQMPFWTGQMFLIVQRKEICACVTALVQDVNHVKLMKSDLWPNKLPLQPSQTPANEFAQLVQKSHVPIALIIHDANANSKYSQNFQSIFDIISRTNIVAVSKIGLNNGLVLFPVGSCLFLAAYVDSPLPPLFTSTKRSN